MAAETHIHADYVSGLREFAEQHGAQLLVSDEGPPEWKYEFVDTYNHVLLKDGQHFTVGHIDFEVLHTPGHTPESISLLLTDKGGGASEPMGLFTGDFVFVGAIGRPDLLEEVAGQQDSAEEGARDLYASLTRFKQLPDFVQVWPAHGAGSACGKGLGAVPSSTVGYEKRFNPALQFSDERSFVQYVLDDQPKAPRYFAIMKKVNKQGPTLLSKLDAVPVLDDDHVDSALDDGTVIDIASTRHYQQQHIPGSINIPQGMLASWAGWLLDYNKPVYLIGTLDNISDEKQAISILRKMGVDSIAGVFDRQTLLTVRELESYDGVSPLEAAKLVETGKAVIVDVRGEDERQNIGYIDGSLAYFLGDLSKELDTLPRDKTIITQCASGIRSGVAASLIKPSGRQVLNLDGGYTNWRRSGL